MLYRSLRTLMAALFLCSAFSANAQQIDLYVDSIQSVSGVGTSWSTAYKTLGEALVVANANRTSGVYYNINIAKGTYYPTGIQSDTNRNASFLITRGIRLLGGYPTGGGTRQFSTNPTVLSGDIGTPSDSTDNSYNVVFAFNSWDTVVLDGLTVTKGVANGTGDLYYNGIMIPRISGGGMILESTNASIRNCLFTQNYASGYGGGIFDRGGANLWIYNSEFKGNNAIAAGGSVFTQNATPTIDSSIFSDNTAGRGGAICYGKVVNTTGSIRKTTFTNNKALLLSGGAIDISNASGGGSSSLYYPCIFDSLTFIGNSAATTGGAVDIEGLSGFSGSDVHFRSSIFTGNNSITGGGAIYYNNTLECKLDTCGFMNNKTATGSGGAARIGGPSKLNGVTFLNDSAIASNGGALWVGNNSWIYGCTFNGNYSGGNGGALSGISFAGMASQTICDCTFDGNTADSSGGGIYLYQVTLERCKVRGNKAINGDGGGVALGSSGSYINNTLISGNAAVRGGASYWLQIHYNAICTVVR